MLMAPSLPKWKSSELASLTIGQRNAHLLLLRERLISSTLHALVNCPKCAAPLEFTEQTENLLEGYTPPLRKHHRLEAAGLTLDFRLLTSTDLALSGGDCASEVRSNLVRRSIMQASRDGKTFAAAELDHSAMAALESALELHDPLCNVWFKLNCAACDHVWKASLDIVFFLWTELRVLVTGILEDVREIALSYGWRESDILAMSPARRRYYLGEK